MTLIWFILIFYKLTFRPHICPPTAKLASFLESTVSSTQEWGLSSEGVHHPVEIQLCSYQPISSSLKPEWSISSASQRTVQSQLSPSDLHHLQKSMDASQSYCTPHGCLFVFWYSGVLAHAHEGVLSPRTLCFAYSRGNVPSYWREEHHRDEGCSQSIHWYSGKIHSIGFCWPGFEPQESAFSMETVSGCYEWLPSQNSWKSPLPVTPVWWTFVVTVLNKS